MTSALEPPARGCRGAGRARWSRSEMPFLGFHSHVTVSELPWPPHPHPTSSLPTHNPGLIRKTETCSRKGLVAENTAGWTSGPLAMKTSIVPLPGPAGPHLGPPAPALKRTAAGGGGRADGAVERASQGVSRTGATACNRNWGAHSAPRETQAPPVTQERLGAPDSAKLERPFNLGSGPGGQAKQVVIIIRGNHPPATPKSTPTKGKRPGGESPGELG